MRCKYLQRILLAQPLLFKNQSTLAFKIEDFNKLLSLAWDTRMLVYKIITLRAWLFPFGKPCCFFGFLCAPKRRILLFSKSTNILLFSKSIKKICCVLLVLCAAVVLAVHTALASFFAFKILLLEYFNKVPDAFKIEKFNNLLSYAQP